MNILQTHQLFALLINSLPKKSRIIEVGAFIGNHTVKFIEHLPDVEVYAFEPVPHIYRSLCERTSQHENVHCYPLAVSDEVGQAALFVAHNPQKPTKVSSASSLHQAKNRLAFSPIVYPETIQVQKTTLDTWILQSQISLPIDLLWIDVQGHEYYVLEGAKNLLKSVRLIHVEVHFGNPYEGQREYNDVLNLLEKQGFVEVARDFSKTDIWFFGNVLLKNAKYRDFCYPAQIDNLN